jgi:Pyridoxamine 5'-phosphate oxidase
VAEREPVVELPAFSSKGASATTWARGREQFGGAQIYWLSTVRPNGRPHVTPLLGVWRESGLYFCAGPSERKAKNLTHSANCILTTGRK